MAKNAKQNQPSQSRRDLLAQQREAEAARQRKMKILTVGAIVVGILIIIAVVAVVIGTINENNRNNPSGDGTPGAQINPPNATAALDGIILNPGTAQEGAPVLEVHSDYQCGACVTYEAYFGDAIHGLADKGLIQLQRHQRIFRDRAVGNDSSLMGTIGATCADTVGAYVPYDEAIWTMAASGTQVGFTVDQLRNTFPAQSGITGEDLTKFQQCFDTKATYDFVNGMESKSTAAGVNATPTYLVNGKKIDLTNSQPTEEGVLAVILAAAG